MPYVTVPMSPCYHQVSFEDIIFNRASTAGISRDNKGNTVTRITNNHEISVDKVVGMISALNQFNINNSHLNEVDRHELYNTFRIPKKSGGLRTINAPLPELSAAIEELKYIFEDKMGAMYHTSAYAYVKGRCTIDAVKKHQANNSRWFLHTDFSDFFGSTTLSFTMDMLSKIVPFCDVIELGGEGELRNALELCFLDGGLPQGTKISPMLTNLIMIPIDHAINSALRERNLIYTRYADDIIVSGFQKFDYVEIVNLIDSICASFRAPYKIKPSKTHFGSSAGSNWNLGVMLNKDNEITIGHKNKKSFRAMVHNYLMDKTKNISWPIEDVQTFNGLISYYKMVEEKYIEETIASYNRDFNMDLMTLIKADLSV